MIHVAISLFHKKIIVVIFVAVVIIAALVSWYVVYRSNRFLSCAASEHNCQVQNAPYQDARLSVDQRVTDLLERMTLEEKIGQLVLVEKNSIEDNNDITRYGIGALLSGGGANPTPNTPLGWLSMVRDFQAQTQQTRLRIPLLYGVDAVHGHAGVVGATVFPHQIALGATNDPALVTKIGQATADELQAMGIYWNFSPSLDVAGDARWGRVYETFGQYPQRVGTLGQAMIEGLQQESPSGTIAVLATAKHFMGNGATSWGTSSNSDFYIDQGKTLLTEKQLRQTQLPPFQQAIDAGVMSVMVGLNTWQDKKITENAYLLTDVLKKESSFSGFVVSDWYGVYAITENKYDSTVLAINAGVDMVMLPFDYELFISHVRRAVTNGDISQERIDDAVARILRVKFLLGLFDREPQDDSLLSNVGSVEHRELAREAVRKSVVLLKNKGGALPIDTQTPSILVAGSAADNVGMQSGGWTVEWQGIDGNWLPGAVSVLDGIQNAVPDAQQVTYERNADVDSSRTFSVGIAVVGEKPYAEGWGDRTDLRLSEEDRATIKKVRAVSDTLIVVIVSGRPLQIHQDAQEWDGIVAAWLPGTQGDGVADVLFGDYPFTGTLPIPWPISTL